MHIIPTNFYIVMLKTIEKYTSSFV